MTKILNENFRSEKKKLKIEFYWPKKIHWFFKKVTSFFLTQNFVQIFSSQFLNFSRRRYVVLFLSLFLLQVSFILSHAILSSFLPPPSYSFHFPISCVNWCFSFCLPPPLFLLLHTLSTFLSVSFLPLHFFDLSCAYHHLFFSSALLQLSVLYSLFLYTTFFLSA